MANTNQRVFKNTTKVIQLIYDRFGNPKEVKPGQTFVEDITEVIDTQALVRKEEQRRTAQNDVDQMKELTAKLDLIKEAKTIEDLQPLKENETNQDVVDAIMLREQELLKQKLSKKK